ncbi:hypothetical protein DPMN_184628 [Dreissena polymorpha]|uniref:Neurotransmitter-gated ion-channel ligand-binding domain-containing protein n=1 Tax=Dreissena polymorpha TaxID=45954 RepID=A0A9D4DJ43_DREPO|nr:hypothetical protein DPMN_184628 [Dreissena polymorpha]
MAVVIVTMIMLIGLLSSNAVGARTVSDTENFLSNLTNGYNVNVRPVVEQLSAVNVTMQLYDKSIMEVDEVQGILSYTTGIKLLWMDYRLRWDPREYGGLQTLANIALSQIWFPEVILSSPVTGRGYLSESWSKARLIWNGIVLTIVLWVLCSVDINLEGWTDRS